MQKFLDMIQRRQTIFMILSAISCALLFFMPLATVKGTSVDFTIWGWSTINDPKSYVWPIVVLTILMTALPFVTIFLYKKRMLQVRLCRIEMLLNIVFIGLVFLVYDKDYILAIQSIENAAETLKLACSIGLLMPLVSLIFEVFAIRGIKKDIDLLKSVDRLR